MIDKQQINAVRSQSTAVVSAALITTMGAVTAACIQSGWILRPADGTVAFSQPAPRTTFMEPDRKFEIPVLPPQPAVRVTADKPVFEPHSTVLRPEMAVQPLVGDTSWSAAANPMVQQRRNDPKKSSSKFWDWGAMTRWFNWNL